ncbi:hypothetical protein DEO72_LG7g1140 [Vigna unguiculata]|uniref:Uncharacterized protein n=1 Tax=Vigna unguiculata TaxID=3917 RepID=A0A4D6MJG8_VIGUN|nr:hypothetical protein DEO72_LG7g1140 [Vigna unguiculata]
MFIRHPKPQLKRCHLSHNSRNDTCLTPISSNNSRDMFCATTQGTPASRPSGYQQSLVDHTHPKQANTRLASTLSPGAVLELPDKTCFKTAWRGTRTVRRQAPLMPLTCRCRLAGPASPPGATRF